jgi:hypothetical protein
LLTGKCRVEIDDVKIIATFALPAARERGGITRVNGLLIGPALLQAHNFARHEIDRGKEKHESEAGRLVERVRKTHVRVGQAVRRIR